LLWYRYDGNVRAASNPRMVYLGARAPAEVVVVICGMPQATGGGNKRQGGGWIDPKMGAMGRVLAPWSLKGVWIDVA
jgi:hypothetical protein